MFLRLLETWAQLEKVERQVLVEIASRLLMGQLKPEYGPLNLERDTRDFLKEAKEEILDGCVYLACKAVREKET